MLSGVVGLNNNFVFFLLDVEIKFPEGELNFDKYLGHGQQAGEESLPEDAPVAAGQFTSSWIIKQSPNRYIVTV